MESIISVVSVLSAVGLVAGYAVCRRHKSATAVRAWTGGLASINGLAILMCAAFVLLTLTSPMPVLADETAPAAASSNTAIGAALATGLACIGCGIAVGIAGAAAIGSITEKPEVLGKTLIFVGLAEGIAIYGLIISFMILNA